MGEINFKIHSQVHLCRIFIKNSAAVSGSHLSNLMLVKKVAFHWENPERVCFCKSISSFLLFQRYFLGSGIYFALCCYNGSVFPPMMLFLSPHISPALFLESKYREYKYREYKYREYKYREYKYRISNTFMHKLLSRCKYKYKYGTLINPKNII